MPILPEVSMVAISHAFPIVEREIEQLAPAPATPLRVAAGAGGRGGAAPAG